MIADGDNEHEHTTAAGAAPREPRRGPIVPIGGAEDKRRERVILARFVELAGGKRAHLVIVPTASSIEDAGQYYKGIFLDLGAATAEVAYIPGRHAANDPETVELFEGATGIYITGGNQMRLATILGGSRVEAAIRARNAAGAVVAGTSAGASILSAHMVAQGSGGHTPKQRMAQMGAGFGLLDGVVIDQHFRERDRIGRLLALVALNPRLLGLGIDEDTAAIIDADGIPEVLGRGICQQRTWATLTSKGSNIAVEIASNEELTNRLLRNVGIPVPRAIDVGDEEGAVAAARRIGYPVVLKPLDGNHGRGVGINLPDEAAVRAHYRAARRETRSGVVSVESYITGRDYRILVVGGKVIAVAERVPAHAAASATSAC